MKKDNEIWDDYSFVIRAKNRKSVLKALVTPQTPSSIQRANKISLNVTSRALRELSRKKLIICKTPKLKVGRVYVLTRKGKKVLEMLRK